MAEGLLGVGPDWGEGMEKEFAEGGHGELEIGGNQGGSWEDRKGSEVPKGWMMGK